MVLAAVFCRWKASGRNDAWFVGAGTGVRVYDSGAPQLETDYDVKTQTMVVTATSYHGRVVTDWRGYFANNKATS